jgi:frizzled protein 5/8
MDPRKNEAPSISPPPKLLPSSRPSSCCQCNTSLGYRLIVDDDESIKKCLPPCYSPYFSDEQSKSMMNIWLTFLSLLCAISCAFVLLTFFIDITRFKYPQRPIIFLSLCYFFVSCGYLIRLSLGHENVACRLEKLDSSSYIQLVRVSGPSNCAFVFVLTYFFGMASSVWWVILTLTWFLAAGFKWSSEAIAHYSVYYHLIAWLLPCLQTIAILMLNGIDGDPISGICYVGHTDSSMLRGFVILPLIAFLTIGTIFLLGGLISLMRIRNVMKVQDRTKTSKLEKLMVRIGLYSILYTVPATFVCIKKKILFLEIFFIFRLLEFIFMNFVIVQYGKIIFIVIIVQIDCIHHHGQINQVLQFIWQNIFSY